MRDDCALVVPAYREAGAIGAVVTELVAIARVFVVDDASGDGTADEAAAAGAIVVRLSENRGYGGAIEAGFREAVRRGFQRIVTVDGDGQHDPADVQHAVRAVTADGFELAIGIRPGRRRFVESLCSHYSRIRFGVHDPLCGLKGYDTGFFHSYGGFDLRRSVQLRPVLRVPGGRHRGSPCRPG